MEAAGLRSPVPHKKIKGNVQSHEYVQRGDIHITGSNNLEGSTAIIMTSTTVTRLNEVSWKA